MAVMVWLDDKSNEDFGFIVQRTTSRPALPPTVDRVLDIPGRHGAWDFGADLRPRQFLLECVFLTRDALELQKKLSELARFLVDTYGRPRNIRLRFRERPNQTFTVRFAGSFDVDRIFGTGVFSLPLVAYDPFAYGPEQVFETTITTSPYMISVRSNGDVRTPPVIVLVNNGTETITEIRITNEYLLEG